MRIAINVVCAALFVLSGGASARAQDAEVDTRSDGGRAPLAQWALAYDADGREVLAGNLLTQDLAGTPDAPVRNTRIVIRNRSPLFFNYAQGWATFYGENGVRCGEGLWKLEAFAPDERVEVDTPGLRVTCRPATWRLVATTLLTRTSDVAKPGEAVAPPPAARDTTSPTFSPATAGAQPLEININGKTIPIQLGNPLEVTVGRERVRIVVQSAP